MQHNVCNVMEWNVRYCLEIEDDMSLEKFTQLFYGPPGTSPPTPERFPAQGPVHSLSLRPSTEGKEPRNLRDKHYVALHYIPLHHITSNYIT